MAAPEGSSPAELVRATGTTSGAVHREVERLERAGIVRSHRVGRTRVVEPDPDSPFYADPRSLLMPAFGPVPVLTTRLQDLEAVVKLKRSGIVSMLKILLVGRHHDLEAQPSESWLPEMSDA